MSFANKFTKEIITLKKLLTLALTAVMLNGTGITALAVDYPGGSQDTELTTSVAPTFTVSIPADTAVPFNSLSTDFGSVTLESARLEPNKFVCIQVDTDFNLKNSQDETKVIPYTVMTDVFDVKDHPFSFTEAGESYALNINITQADWDAAAGGDYSDTVTFVISYEDIE